MLKKSIAKKDPDTYEPWMKALMCADGKSCDWTDKNYLIPLMKYLQRNHIGFVRNFSISFINR